MAQHFPEAPAAGSTGIWQGGVRPMGARYGKLMMWFFLVSDAFTFSGLLISYGLLRISHEYWPDPDVVYQGVPLLGDGYPLVFVGIMTFILIMSSVTMVLAVEYGHRLKKWPTAFYMFLTILGGATFLGCQAWEWSHLLHKHEAYVLQEDGSVKAQIVSTTVDGNYWGPTYVMEGGKPKLLSEKGEIPAKYMHEDHGDHALPAQAPDGALVLSPGPENFGQFFFTITGFHGFHVFSGVIINIIVLIYILNGFFARKGDYEMVEKVGLYWHFVDLVWVFVFTFFYLV